MSDFIDFGSVIVRKDQIVMIETFEESGKYTFKITLDKSKSEHEWLSGIWTVKNLLMFI